MVDQPEPAVAVPDHAGVPRPEDARRGAHDGVAAVPREGAERAGRGRVPDGVVLRVRAAPRVQQVVDPPAPDHPRRFRHWHVPRLPGLRRGEQLHRGALGADGGLHGLHEDRELREARVVEIARAVLVPEEVRVDAAIDEDPAVRELPVRPVGRGDADPAVHGVVEVEGPSSALKKTSGAQTPIVSLRKTFGPLSQRTRSRET